MLLSFDKEIEAINFRKFICSKFARFILKQALTSMNISKDDFKFIPIMDWNIEWSDELLYEYFSLTKEEINHIESIMRPIEVS
jgi:site-specific DNA-methyltransferase (adenine-specific)